MAIEMFPFPLYSLLFSAQFLGNRWTTAGGSSLPFSDTRTPLVFACVFLSHMNIAAGGTLFFLLPISSIKNVSPLA